MNYNVDKHTANTKHAKHWNLLKAVGVGVGWMSGCMDGATMKNPVLSSQRLNTLHKLIQRDSTTWTPGKARRLQKNQDFHVQKQLYNFLTARIQRTSSEIRGHLLIRHWQHAGHRTVAAPKNVLLEQGSSADLDHVELLDVVVPQHGGGELRSKHRVVARAAQHQVGSVHWNKGYCALCALLCTGNGGVMCTFVPWNRSSATTMGGFWDTG